MTSFLISKPSFALCGEMLVPGDKSISHRALIFGAIAQGVSIIHGFLQSEDCLATLHAFQQMSVSIECLDNKQVIIHGVGKRGLQKPKTAIDCGNSGTSMRLLAGLLATQPFESVLTGDPSLLNRPMARISEPLLKMGANISVRNGKAPILLKGAKKLRGIRYQLPSASAQVKSCILLAGMYAEGETRVIEKSLSRDHTELMLKQFCYPLHQEEKTLIINSNYECQAAEIFIPGDLSSAAFFIVAATLIPGSNLLIRQVGVNPTRTGILDILTAMGADIKWVNKRQQGDEWVADLRIQHAPLKGIKISSDLVARAIDEFPIIFIAAACAKGTTILQGAEELRFKESDRIVAMVKGLNQLGVVAQALDDGAIIKGGSIHGGTVDSFGDHRIAMSFAIAGAIAQAPIVIKNCVSIATSFPEFVAKARMMQLQIEEVTNDV